MKQWYAWLILSMIPFGLKAGSSDSMSLRPQLPVWKFEAGLSGTLSQGGYSSALTGMARWRRLGFNAGVKMLVNQTYVVQDAPLGIVTGLYFFPNCDGEKFTGFMNIDYQATFNGKAKTESSLSSESLLHEYTAGYGFRYKMGKRMNLLSSVNIGRYTQVLYNPVLDKTSTYSGFNTMVRFGINYEIKR